MRPSASALRIETSERITALTLRASPSEVLERGCESLHFGVEAVQHGRFVARLDRAPSGPRVRDEPLDLQTHRTRRTAERGEHVRQLGIGLSEGDDDVLGADMSVPHLDRHRGHAAP